MIVITKNEGHIFCALIDDQDKIVSLRVESLSKASLVGNIYIGKVMQIAKGLKAAFLDIGLDQHVFMGLEKGQQYCYTNDKASNVLPIVGDELLVQVVKAGTHVKAPKVKPHLDITGTHLVLTYGNTTLGLSGKIQEGSIRKQLKKVMQPFINTDYGWIIRTNAKEASAETLEAEAATLAKRFEDLMAIMPFRPYKSCLLSQERAYRNFIRDAYQTEWSKILCDDLEIYEDLKTIGLGTDVVHFVKNSSLYVAYGFEKTIKKATQTVYWLKSGANITIEPTEALNVIDVNSAKMTVKNNKGDYFYRINIEAAGAIAKQIRLRNLSGIIIIDFIDMPDEAQKQDLLKALRQLVAHDPIKTEVIDMTPLGLVEMTRKKALEPLSEQLKS